jgi:hypothetical protein
MYLGDEGGFGIMIILAFVDDNMGTMFNHRRQTKDKSVIERILNSEVDKVYVSSYTAKLFNNFPNTEKIIVDDDMLDNASDDDICIVEGQDLTNYIDKIYGLILYKWNKVYPSDTKLGVDLSEFSLVHTDEFTGYSHENITEELYTKAELEGMW